MNMNTKFMATKVNSGEEDGGCCSSCPVTHRKGEASKDFTEKAPSHLGSSHASVLSCMFCFLFRLILAIANQ